MSNKLLNKSIELFESQFAWSYQDKIDNCLHFKDYSDLDFHVCVIEKSKLWKRNGFKYESIIVRQQEICHDKDHNIDYYCFMNKKRNQAFICKSEDLIKPDNIIFKNYQYENKTYYNAPCYQIHLSMCELFDEREDGWYETN